MEPQKKNTKWGKHDVCSGSQWSMKGLYKYRMYTEGKWSKKKEAESMPYKHSQIDSDADF